MIKSLWGLGLTLAATTQRPSTKSQTLATPNVAQPYRRRKTKVRWSHLSLALTVALAVMYPIAADQRHPFLNSSVDIAIGLSSCVVIYRATNDRSQRSAGAALCLSLALATSLFIGDYSVALNLAAITLLAQTITDRLIGRSLGLSSSLRSNVPPAGANSDSKPGLSVFEKSGMGWLQDFLTYLSLVAAGFAIFLTGEVRPAVAVLIVGSASALGSVMYLLTIGCATQFVRHGILAKKDGFLERLARINIAVLDEFGITELSAANNRGDRAAGNVYGKTRRAIESLRAMKIETVLFTSASEAVGKALGQQLGLDRIEAELFPDDKPFKVAGLQRRRGKVVFFGCESSCGPAMGIADVGIVAGSEHTAAGSDADAVFLSNDLNDFVEVLRVARCAHRIANIGAVVGVVVASAGIGIAMQGRFSPQWAISVAFTLQLAAILAASQLLIKRRLPTAHIASS